MKFSFEFIKEFCDPAVTPQDLARRLTLAGMEVASLHQEKKDWVFEIEVTANRYDWLSIIGISREVAAVCGCKIKVDMPEQEDEEELKEIRLSIAASEDCPLYIGRYIKGVTVQDSPQELKDKLSACGISLVNNVVDITNYCMLKWGNPLHAFDADKIEGEVRVRRAEEEEKFFGLDKKERILNRENLVIADDKKILALAGVMGAANCEVDSKTENIVLEAALFSPLTVRRSRRSAGLETDSSYRFERRVLPEYVDVASAAARNMILDLAGGRKSGKKVCGSIPRTKTEPIRIELDHFYGYIGHEIAKKQIGEILEHLGFKVKNIDARALEVTAPVFRLDIQREVDVYEEITRIYGYDNIPSALPALLPSVEKGLYQFQSQVRNFMVSLGLREMISFSITSDEVLKKIGQEKFLPLSNPLRSQENALRPTLLTGALDVVRHNLNQKADRLKLFELGSIYQNDNNSCRETPMLSITVSGVERPAMYLRGLIEQIIDFLNLKDCLWQEIRVSGFSAVREISFQGKVLGKMGKVSASVCREWDIKQDLFFFQADLSVWQELRKEKKYQPFSRYPFVCRDISLALGRDMSFADIEARIREKAQPWLRDLEVVDIYQGKKLSSGEKGLTVRVFYQSEEKTLTSQEVDSLHNSLRDSLAAIPGLTVR